MANELPKIEYYCHQFEENDSFGSLTPNEQQEAAGIVSWILLNNNPETSEALQYNEYLKSFLEFTCRALSGCTPDADYEECRPFIECVCQIISQKDAEFYVNHQLVENIDNEEGDEGSFENDDLPSLFRHNISFFFEIDGINAFIRFFENKYSDIPMEGVIAMFNSLFQACRIHNPNDIENLADYLCEYLCVDMPEELLNKADIKGIQDLVHSIQANLDCVQPRRDIKVKQMQLALDIGFRLVRSSLLEKKLAGIGMIKSNIPFSKSRTISIVERAFSNWVHDAQFLQAVFSENLHLSILQRMGDVLEIMLSLDQMTVEDLHLIWGCVQRPNQHMSVKQTVLKLLAQNTQLFTVKLAIEMLGLLEKYPTAQFDANVINIIDGLILLFKEDQDFKQLVQYRQVESDLADLLSEPRGGDPLLLPYRMMMLLWNVSNDSSTIADDIKARAINSLHRSLEQYDLFPVCFRIINLVIKRHLAERNSVPAALELLHKIFDILGKDVIRFERIVQIPLDSFLDYILDELGLLQLILDDFLGYKVKARDSLASHPVEDVDGSILYGTYPHLKQIQQRLDALLFLHQLTERFPLMEAHISKNQLFLIWQKCVIGSLSPKERESAMKFLANFRTTAGFCEELLTHHVQDLKLNTISETDLIALMDFFLSANANTGKLMIDSQSGAYEVNTMDLIGLDFVWKLAVSVEPIDVATFAIDTLIRIYLSLHEDSAANIYEERKKCRLQFINLCFEQIKSGNIIRSIEILSRFVDYFNRLYPWSFRKQESIRPEPHPHENGPKITVNVAVERHPWTPVEIGSHSTLEELRRLIAERFNLDPDRRIRIFSKGRELDSSPAMSCRTLEQAKLADGENLMVSVVAALTPAVERDGHSTGDLSDSSWIVPDVAREEDLPSNILVQTSNFSTLYAFLRHDNLKIAEGVWKLLWDMPDNQEHFAELENLCASPVSIDSWHLKFDPSRPYLCLYNLRVLDSLFQRRGITEIASTSNVISGLSHDFSQYNLAFLNRSSADMECFLKISAVIYGFISKSTDPNQLQMDFAAITKKIMDVLVFVGRSLPSLASADRIANHMLALLFFSGSRLAVVSDNALRPEAFHALIWDLLVPSKREKSAEGSQFYDNVFQRISEYFSLSTSPSQKHIESVQFFQLSLTATLQSTADVIKKQLMNSNEYFKLLQQIATIALDGEIDNKFLQSACEQLISKILTYPYNEHSEAPDDVDYYLTGICSLCALIIERHPELAKGHPKLLHLLFNDFLFQIGGSSMVPGTHQRGPKCLSSESRSACLDLLKSLVWHDPENYSTFLSLLLSQQNRDNEPFNTWLYEPVGESKAVCGRIGLRNLGTTCYMNSILQQFFMIPSFRKSVFTAKENKLVESADNLLYQLQRMFGFLQESERKSFDTTSFAYACKDYEGNPTNTSVQMDVDEFFNLLFDRLENQLKGTKDEKIFKDHFGGALVHQIKSKECCHVSEREESFFAVQCEVKNWKDLGSSLQGYVQGEMLEGDNKYHCSNCQTLVNAVKRACIKTLPKHLIITLKRFDFDFEAMRRIKINKRFEFPDQVDMQPFTADFIQKQESDEQQDNKNDVITYRLGGILVHTGTADSGHYYSFIKERSMCNRINEATAKNRWYHFNDSAVEHFDENEIPFHCFGGSGEGSAGPRKSSTGGRPFNAYILVYDRDEAAQDQSIPRFEDIPSSIRSEISQDNSAFLHDKHLFDHRYLWFVQSFLEKAVEQRLSIPAADFCRTIQLGSRFFLHTLSHYKDVGLLHSCGLTLKKMFAQSPPAQIWFLDYLINDRYCMKQLLFDCFAEEVRKEFIGLVLAVVSAFREKSVSFLSENLNNLTEDSYGLKSLYDGLESSVKIARSADSHESEVRCGPSMVRFLETLLSYLPTIETYWRNFDQYWTLLWQIAILGPHERRFMIRKGIFARLVDFFLETDSPLAPAARKRMGDRFLGPNLTDFFQLLAVIIRQYDVVRPFQAVTGNMISEYNEGLIQFSKKEWNLLLALDKNQDFLFFSRLISNCVDIKLTAQVLRHFCHENPEAGQNIISSLYRTVAQSKDTSRNSFAFALKSLIELEDSICLTRRLYILDLVLKSMGKQPAIGSAFLLFELHKLDESMDELLINQVNNWLIQTVLRSENEGIRNMSETIVRDMVECRLSKVTPAANDSEWEVDVECILRCLLEAIDMARNFTGLNYHGQLASFFASIEHCIVSPALNILAGRYLSSLIALVPALCSRGKTDDADQKQLILLLHKLVMDRPDLIAELCQNESYGHALLEFNQGIDLSRQEITDYNNSTLPVLYEILLSCIKCSEVFADQARQSRTINWVLSHICYFTNTYYQASDKLVEILKALATSDYFRTSQIKSFLETINRQDCFICHAKFIHLIEVFMINAEDALQLLHSKVLRRFVQIFTASKPPSTMEQKHSALELLLKLTTLLLSPSARSHPAWHRIISNSIEASFYLCRSLLFMLNLNFPPILVTLTCDVETSLMDIFPQNIDGIFELLYDSQVEFSRLSKERSEEYFNVFRGQFSPFADALPPPVITYSSTQTKRVIGLFFDSKEWWESLPVDRREIAQQECYLPYYKLVCACCERASIKFSVESWHLACIIAKQAMITDDTGCVQSFLKISKDRDQLMEISGPDFDNKMQQLRGEMLEFLTVLFHEYPLKLSLPLYAEISLVGFEMVFGQSVGEVEVQFFDSISIAAIELIDKWRSWQSEATPKESIWRLVRMAASKSLLDKLPQGRRIQETIQILKNESITVINQLLADVAADQRHGIVAAIGRTYPVICKLCS